MSRKNRPALEIKEEDERSYNFHFDYGTKDSMFFRCSQNDLRQKMCSRRISISPQSHAMVNICERKSGKKTRKEMKLNLEAPRDILYEKTHYRG
jgi:hypothetical protein